MEKTANGVAAPKVTAGQIDADTMGMVLQRLGMPTRKPSPVAAGAGEAETQPTEVEQPAAAAGEPGAEGENPGAEGGAGGSEGEIVEGQTATAGDEPVEVVESPAAEPKFVQQVKTRLTDLQVAPEVEAEVLKLIQPFQHAFDTRVGQLTKEKKDATEQLATAQTERGQLLGQVESLTQQVQELQGQPQARAQGVHPLLLVEDPARLAQESQRLDKTEEWLLTHWDGYEGSGKENDPAWTPEQVRQTYAQVKQVKERILPQAQNLLNLRRQADEYAYKTYPQLKDRNHPDHQLVEQVLRTYPVLRTIPNVRTILGDSLVGQKLRQEKEAGARKPATPAKPAPRVPTAAAPAARSPVPTNQTKKPTPGLNAKQYVKGGATHQSLVQTVLKSGLLN